MSEFKRSARVSEGVREALSAILSEGLRDPDVGYVTVTDVSMTDDLRQAKIFVSVYGDAKKTLAALKRAAPYLRRELGARVKLRFAPELLFEKDATIEQGARIETLLKRIGDGNTDDLVVEALPAALPVKTARDLEPVVAPPPLPKRPPKKKRRR